MPQTREFHFECGPFVAGEAMGRGARAHVEHGTARIFASPSREDGDGPGIRVALPENVRIHRDVEEGERFNLRITHQYFY